MQFSTWVEIDLDALISNIEQVRARVGTECRILLVVKADGYGHGAVEVARVAVKSGVEMLGVATLHEGIELRQAGIDAPVLILSPALESETDGIAEYDLSCTVPSLSFARALSMAFERQGTTGTVHVEVDTGMGRSGVRLEDALFFVSAVGKIPNLDLEGIFTHFPSSDEDRAFTKQQVERFGGLLDELEQKGLGVPLRHAANSGAVLDTPDSYSGSLNMVRPGIAIYGLNPSASVAGRLDLTPVMTFKSRIAQLRDLPPGHTISYGRTFVTPRTMRIAVVPVGYGHGYSFRLSNVGEVLIGGKRAPIVGRVTMDVTMVDVSELSDVSVADEVVLFGSQGGEQISVDEVAEKSGTINYEVICGIGKRVARAYVQSGHTVGVRTLVERRVIGRRR